MNKQIPKIRGCYEDVPSTKDFIYEEFLAGAPDIVIPTFKESFDNEEKYGKLFSDDQERTYSCVGQGSSNDLEMDILRTTGEKVHLSAKYIYSQIALQNGGASPRDAYKLMNKQGVCEYDLLPSRTPTGAISETFIRNSTHITQKARESALKYKIGAYYSIRSYNMDVFARAIYENGGVGGGYRGISSSMGHFIFFKGYTMHKGYQALKYKDSISGGYGDGFDKFIIKKGDNFYLDSPKGTRIILFSHWTFQSGNYPSDMIQLVRKKGTKRVFLRIGNERYWIKDIVDFKALQKAQPLKGFEWDEIEEVPQFTSNYNGRIIGKANFADALKELFGL